MLGAPKLAALRARRRRGVGGPGGGGRPVGGRGGESGEGLDPVAGGGERIRGQPGEQSLVARTAHAELGVRALLDDPALLEHDDPTGELERRAAVGDQQRRAPGHVLAQSVVDRLLDRRVHGAGGVVEDQDRRVREDCARERDPLPLPAREREAALADHGLVSLWQLLDELVGGGRARRRLDLRVARVGAPVGDVRPDRVREEEALLEDDPDLAAQRLQRHAAEVVAVDEHGAAVGVMEARHEHRQRRLARAAGSDERDPLAGRDPQIDAGEHGGPIAVVEVDPAQLDLAAQPRQLDRVGRVGDRRLEVEQLEDPLDAGARLLGDRQHAREDPRRGGELRDVGREGEEGAELDLVVQLHPATEREDRDLPEARDHAQQGLVARLQAHRAHARAVEPLRRVDQPPKLARLLAE